MENYSAVYRDQHGRTYSCPVVKKNDGAWAMVTSDGPQPITHEFQDDVGGLLTFVEYRQKDSRIHVEPGGNFRTLQEAAMRVTAEYETNRQRARREMLAQLNQPDAQKIQDGRRINREFADMKRPRGKGAAFIVKSGE